MEIKRINTPNAPQPAGHYSQATVYNGLVFVAGQLLWLAVVLYQNGVLTQ